MVQDLGGYRLIEELGSGGMGVVYLGVDGGNNPVAVKVLHAHIANDETARKRLAREVRTLRRIKHPRIAEVLDAELEAAQPFIITEFVDGQTLSDDVRDNGPFAEDELVHFGHALLDALNAVHSAGVIHRDLKPANVMIMDGEPMVIDFGIAQVADEVRVTATGLVMGTPGYLSPEIADGKTSSEKTDWWGWAATMAYAATGRNPYGSGPLEAVLGRVAMGKFDLDGSPPNFVPLLRACLDPKPERRPSGQIILDALVDIESGRMPQLGSTGGPGRSATGTAVMPAVDDRPGQAPGGSGHGSPRGGYPGQGHPGAVAGGAAAGGALAGAAGASAAGAAGHPQARGQDHRGPVPGPGVSQNGAIHAGPGSPLAHGDFGPGRTAVGAQRPAVDAYGRPLGAHGQPMGPGQQGRPGPMSPGQQPGQGQPGPMAQGRPGPMGPGQQPGPGQPGPMGQGQPWQPMTHQRVRSGGWVVFVLVLLAVVIMPMGPLVISLIGLLWSIAARTTSRLTAKAQRYRFERGADGRSGLRAVASAPGAILASALTSAASFILPGIAGIAALVLTRLDIAGLVPIGYSEQWSVWAAGGAASLVLWFGPGAASLRRGSRTMVAASTRNQLGRLIALASIVLLIVLGLLVIQSGAGMNWWPLSTSPFTYLPEPV